MNYHLNTHCPNCFSANRTAVCTVCDFDCESYLTSKAASHHLPLFTPLDQGYVIGRVLGEGRFAIVYAGIRVADQSLCAIKEYYPQDLAQRGLDTKTVNPKRQPEQLLSWQQRFVQESQLLRRCYEAPSVEAGIVRYIDLVAQHNTAYLVMERLSGCSLSHYLTQRYSLSPDAIYLWLVPLVKIVQKLHQKKIYHRDISPNNIFLLTPEQPVLMDFGLAREGIRDATLKSSTLEAGVFIAPEQLNGGYCDQRTDLYSLGAVIYLCLHGMPPPSIEARRQGAPLSRLAQTPSALALQRAIEHCLQLEWSARPQDAAHLLTLLTPQSFNSFIPPALPFETSIPERAFGAPPSPLYASTEPSPPTKTHPLLYGLSVFFLTLAILIGLGYAAIMAYRNYDEQESAQRKQDNLLFSQAKSLEDYQNYLNHCITCESRTRAQSQLKQLQLEREAALNHEKQRSQEAALFANAKTLDDFKRYVQTCVICETKTVAQDKINGLVETLKIADETELAADEKQWKEAVKSEAELTAFFQQACPKNLAFWQRTADQGYPLAEYLLGSCYASGDGVTQDYKEAALWYHKAAQQGQIYAQYQLARLFHKGDGVPRNDKQAADWYRKAAEQSHVEAQYALAVLYENGEGVSQDYQQAAKWYRRAAEHNHSQAQYSLAVLYLYGSGVKQDYQAALKWQRQAAEQGNAKAQYGLGTMYENGYGVEPNYQEAYNWYQRAAKQGDQDATTQIKSLEAGMVR